ncbi:MULTISPECIES: hypothetical protein [Sphingomonas]|nr:MULTISPECIES: hypothetical protein [Sphingomonas]ATI56709.1 hypothetical protein CP552_13750 [Sphingomonas melonis]MBX8855394.1 hypothetical protein [Sphingomonas melonis]MBX8900303.1 hypothetical protein [Sphingomonas melonis]MCP4027020.1 hypothetical protein [Sphingomonas sp.]
MRRRWRLAALAGGLIAAIVLVPMAYIEVGCQAPLPGLVAAPDRTPLLPAADRRPEARTFLTYPEWHIVYEAEAFARHLAAGQPPSSFAYGEQIGQFWTSYCAVNRIIHNSPESGAAKVTIYTIGISYTVELAVKAAYERTIGRLFEATSGWDSADDRHGAHVQQRYGAFLHETPWYRFPFREALKGEWQTREPTLHARHWERRFALSAEYGVKALYAKAIDAATGATVGRDEPTLRLVVRGDPAVLRGVDPRLQVVGSLPGGLTVVEAPRYQQFNDLLAKLSATQVQLVEIAGNRTIFATLILPDRVPPPGPAVLAMPIDRTGWRRVGVTVPVARLLPLMTRVRALGGTVEHVYDY